MSHGAPERAAPTFRENRTWHIKAEVKARRREKRKPHKWTTPTPKRIKLPMIFQHTSNKKVKKFPHYEKFTLQKDIRESIDGILDEIEMFEITKVASHLYAADRLKRSLYTGKV